MGRTITAMAVVMLAGLSGGAAITWGQHGHGPGHEGGHRAAQACASEFDKVVGEGRGFGMAFAADQNGYPGPLHVLELKERLALSAEQEATMQQLMHAMFAESKPKSDEAPAALCRPHGRRRGGTSGGRRGRALAE
jgi:hypothetical protein